MSSLNDAESGASKLHEKHIHPQMHCTFNSKFKLESAKIEPSSSTLVCEEQSDPDSKLRHCPRHEPRVRIIRVYTVLACTCTRAQGIPWRERGEV